MKLSEAIGLRVSELLKERQISQFYLFKNGGVPRSTVCDIINHKRSVLAQKQFIKYVPL